MPVIYLKHPTHGSKVAILEAEAEFDEQNGWIRYNPDEPAQESEQDAAPANQLVRRGRPRKEPVGV